MLARQQRKSELTETEVSSLPPSTNMYRSVGKVFIHGSQAQVCSSLQAERDERAKELKRLESQREYLTRQQTAAESNLREIMSVLALARAK